jgi:hypothetical protein
MGARTRHPWRLRLPLRQYGEPHPRTDRRWRTPDARLNQRLIFLELFVGAALVQRERSLTQGVGSRLWKAKPTLDNLIDTLQAMVEAPVSTQTQALVAPTRSRRR